MKTAFVDEDESDFLGLLTVAAAGSLEVVD